MAMMTGDLMELTRLIKQRDKLSMREAAIVVNDCLIELESAIQNHASYDECADIVANYLGLEPEYLEILLNELC
jgi:hypothetical protein